jgi:selenocysteine lyase/cysteine desulfurase
MVVNWDEIREQFPAAKRYVYLNAAACSPISKVVLEETRKCYRELLTHGDTIWEEWLKKKEDVREKIATFLNANKEEVAFTVNTSLGMNLIAYMLKGKGDVVTMQDEFPSSTFPWMNLNYRLRFVKPTNYVYSLQDIKRKTTEQTRILVTSHVMFCTGFKQDLVEVGTWCKQSGLIFVVNATQSMGAFPIDVKEADIDFLVFSCHKWLMAGYGVGVIYLSRKWFGSLKYPVVGWQSVKNPDLMDNRRLDLKDDASVLEVGGLQFPNIFALGATLDLLNRIGMKNIKSRIYELNDYLVEDLDRLNVTILSPLDEKYRSGITVIKVKDPEEVALKLRNKGVIVSARREGLRVSLHIYNNEKDIDVFTSELEKII